MGELLTSPRGLTLQNCRYYPGIDAMVKAHTKGNTRFVLTTEQTWGCLYNERLALNTLPMNYVFFERPLYSNSGSQAHAITG